MYKTICICNVKGGVGKSTLATNIAATLAATSNTLLIDHDTSQVSRKFRSRRINSDKDLEHFNLLTPDDMDEMVQYLEMVNFGDDPLDHKVVDLGGFSDDLARAAMIYADILVVPTNTTTQDMDGNIHFIETMEKLRGLGMETKTVFVANNTNPRMKQQRVESELDYITDLGYKIIATVPHYIAFSESHGLGMSVIEYRPESKAAAAIENLVKLILEEV